MDKSTRIELSREALIATSTVRKMFGYDLSSPINIFDLCDRADVPVRFVDINMEGMYVHMGEGIQPTILISALRPFYRRVFTCAHEYAHHWFKHGLSIDKISNAQGHYSDEEFLVDAFASYLLVPPVGLQTAFKKRKLTFETAQILDFFTIACSFGIGYSTLINHLVFNAHISKEKASQVLRKPLKVIKENIVGRDFPETLVVVDKYFHNKTIDLEASSFIYLPREIEIDNIDYLRIQRSTLEGNVYKVLKPGITRIQSSSNSWSCFLRIQNHQYVGLSKFRHLSE